GAEGQRPHIAAMPWQTRHHLAARWVPKPDRPIAARRGDARAVGVERDSEDFVGMPRENSRTAASRHVPEADCAIAAGREKLLAVAAECDRVDPTGVSGPLGERLEALRVSEDDVLSAGIPAGEPVPVWAESKGQARPCPDGLLRRDVQHTGREQG